MTDPNIEPPLPDLDDIISKVGEWEEAFADLLQGPPIKHVAYEAFSSAYMALNKAQKAIELMEQQS